MSASPASRAARLAQNVVRRVRANPTAERVGGRVAGRVRDSRTAREVVSRVFDLDVTVGGSVFLSAGRLLGGQGLDNLPVVLVLLVGAAADDVPELLEKVAQEQVLTGGFRPVVVLDSDHFGAVRQYGWPVDFVVPQSAWTDPEVAWRDYLRERLRAMRRGYGAVALVELTEPGGLGMDVLASMGTAG
ncbi:hypothetical protein [Georgenia sp. Marseille-Q6866]